jgi:hypothetical protein
MFHCFNRFNRFCGKKRMFTAEARSTQGRDEILKSLRLRPLRRRCEIPPLSSIKCHAEQREASRIFNLLHG